MHFEREHAAIEFPCVFLHAFEQTPRNATSSMVHRDMEIMDIDERTCSERRESKETGGDANWLLPVKGRCSGLSSSARTMRRASIAVFFGRLSDLPPKRRGLRVLRRRPGGS